jgi:hypothetical protein
VSALFACAHDQSMTREECAAARFCSISGVMEAYPADHAWMGRLTIADGACISVSLPEDELARLRRSGPRAMTVRGRVMGDPSADQEVAYLRVNGRDVGLGMCGSFFVYVE